MFIPMLQMKKLRLSEIQSFAQHHPIPEWLSRDSECDSKPMLFPVILLPESPMIPFGSGGN